MLITKLTKQLPARYWDQLTSSWLRHLPSVDPPGSPPTPLINNPDIVYLCEEAKSPKSQTLSSAQAAVPGLRDSVCHESIYWLHKSVHSLGAAERKVQNGMLTWSVIDAYLSAYFSMRCLCGILGVVIFDHHNKTYVIDLCRNFGSMRIDKRELEGAFAKNVSVHTIGVRLDHKQCWQIMQRLLRVLRGETWGQDFSQQIIALESTDFAHHRNRLCYYAYEWLENDLHSPLFENDFATQTVEMEHLEFNKETSSFTINLAFTLVRTALIAYWDIAKLGTILDKETTLLKHSLDELRHPYYGQQLASFLMTS